MTTQLGPAPDVTTEPGAGAPPTPGRRVTGLIAGIVAVVAIVLVAVNARSGPGAARITNPDVSGAPRPVEPLWGFTGWLAVHQIFALLLAVVLVAIIVVLWRGSTRHPVLM